MTCTCERLSHAIGILLSEAYPHVEELASVHTSVDDLSTQLMFELIKEHYKDSAPRHPISYYIKEDAKEANSSKVTVVSRKNSNYTDAIQHTQRYRTDTNDMFELLYGVSLPELEPVEMDGKRRPKGYSITYADYLGLKLSMGCDLLKKLHGGQIDRSHNVSEARFKELFRGYQEQIDKLEPRVNDSKSVIANTFFYFSTETHFLIDFLYGIVLAAERRGFPSDVPSERIIDICGTEIYIPETEWCPGVFMADNFMLMKWGALLGDVFEDSDETWNRKAALLRDCKQLKSRVLQANRDEMVSIVSQCGDEEMADYIVENYWVWDVRPQEYKWTTERIRYFRKLHPLVIRLFEK